jgi:hypothetical protein
VTSTAINAGPRIGSLCSGYRGLDAAVETVFGGTTAWVSDIDPGASAILAHRWPDVPNLGDFTKLDWTKIGRHPMAAPRCDERAQQMYDRYVTGLSLAVVAKEFDVSRQTVYAMFKRRQFDLRPRPPARPSVIWNGARYTLRDVGYYARTTGDRDYLHRDVWRRHRGAIPDGWDIHHRDHDKTNNTISNLECLPKAEHASNYNLGCNGYEHKCGAEVVPSDSPVVDVLTAGYP